MGAYLPAYWTAYCSSGRYLGTSHRHRHAGACENCGSPRQPGNPNHGCDACLPLRAPSVTLLIPLPNFSPPTFIFDFVLNLGQIDHQKFCRFCSFVPSTTCRRNFLGQGPCLSFSSPAPPNLRSNLSTLPDLPIIIHPTDVDFPKKVAYTQFKMDSSHGEEELDLYGEQGCQGVRCSRTARALTNLYQRSSA